MTPTRIQKHRNHIKLEMGEAAGQEYVGLATRSCDATGLHYSSGRAPANNSRRLLERLPPTSSEYMPFDGYCVSDLLKDYYVPPLELYTCPQPDSPTAGVGTEGSTGHGSSGNDP